MKNLTIYGDCDKQDLVILLAVCLEQLSGDSVSLITDRRDKYRGHSSISQVELFKSESKLIIYDMHSCIFESTDLMIFVTDGSQASKLSYFGSADSKEKIVFLNPGGKQAQVVVSSYFPGDQVIEVQNDLESRTEMLATGNYSGKYFNKDLESLVQEILMSYYHISSGDSKELVKSVRRRLT